MKIVIRYNEGEWPIDVEKPHEHNLDDLLDTYTEPEVRLIINQGLRAFRGMCDVWNQRELEARRRAGLGGGG